jgi:hypothetical protein
MLLMTLMTPDAATRVSRIMASVRSSSPERMASELPASMRSSAMRSRSPVACFTAGTMSGAFWCSSARSAAESAQPLRAGMMYGTMGNPGTAASTRS